MTCLRWQRWGTRRETTCLPTILPVVQDAVYVNFETEPNDWTWIDPWWSAYTRSRSVTRRPASELVLDVNQLDDCWEELDPWWKDYAATAVSPDPHDLTALDNAWEELDTWWDTYAEVGHETAEKIAELINESNKEWEQSDSLFDTDPLAADLTRTRFGRGPIQPGNEVEWSRWLAQLIASSEELVSELFDVEIDQQPEEVVREDRLSKREEGFRRPDLLIFHADTGISIEVKLDDENYGKTAETATLVECHYAGREWKHTLLLPKRNHSRLESVVEPAVTSSGGGPLRVQWNEPGPIDVIHWCDVTAAIRSVLLAGNIIDDHWAANAYLFCAVAEQQIMNFQPYPVIQQLAEPENVADTIQPIKISDSLEEQLTYLRKIVDS